MNSKDKDTQLRSKMMDVTPEMAEKWLDGQVHNRTVRDSKVDEYAADMKAGKWRLTHQAIAFTPEDKLIDGQHRLWAVYRSGVTVRLYVTFGVPEDTMVTIDGGINRSLADVIKLDDPDSGVATNHVACSRAMMILSPLSKVRQPSRTEARDFLNKHWEAVRFACAGLPPKRGISLAPVLAAVGRAYYSMPKEKLARFCEVLHSGMPADPSENIIIKLRNWLLDVRAGERVTRQGKEQHGNPFFGKTERALAGFARGEDPKTLYPATDELFPLPEEVTANRRKKIA